MHRIYINQDEKTKSAAELNEKGPYIWENSYEEYQKYNWKKNRKIQFTCERCNKPCVMVRQYIKSFICKSCLCKDREANKDQVAIHNKSKATMLERYGVDNPSQIPGFKDKVTATCRERYGVDHYSQSDEGRERSSKMRKQWKAEGRYEEITAKAQQTLRERYGYDMSDLSVIQRLRDGSMAKYGTEYPAQSDVCKQQTKETVQKRYGVDSVNQLESKKAAARKTCIEKYGVPYYSETGDFLESWKTTLHDRYGVYNPMYHPKFLNKMKQTMIDRYEVDNPSFIDRRSPLLKQVKPVEFDVTFIEKQDGKYLYKCSECGADILSPFANPSCQRCHPYDNSSYVDECIQMLKAFYKGEIIKGNHLSFPADIWIPEYKVAVVIDMAYYISTGIRNNGIVLTNDIMKDQLELFYKWNPDGMVFILTEIEFKQFKHRIVNNIRYYITEKQIPLDTYVMELGKKDADRFLKNYYNPDPSHYTYAIGLFSSSELIAVAAFNISNHKCRITDIQIKSGWALDMKMLFDEIYMSYGAAHIYYKADYRISNADILFDKLTYDGLSAPEPVYLYENNIHYLHVKHMESETRSLLDRMYDGSLSAYDNLDNHCYKFLDAGKILFSQHRFS